MPAAAGLGTCPEMSAAPTVVVEPVFVEEGDNFAVTPASTERIQPARATALEGGGYVVTWIGSSTGNGGEERVYARVFAADDTAVGGAFEVGAHQDYRKQSPSVVTLADGGFVIGWWRSMRASRTGYTRNVTIPPAN